MSEVAPNVVFQETPKQAEFIRAVLSGEFRHLLYGGAAGGGKTWVLCAVLMLLCRVFPGSRWAIVRADLPRLKKTVIPTWNKIAPRPFFSDVNRSDWYVRAANGSEVLFLPASEDIDPDFQRARGLELNGAAFEECDEVSEGYVDLLSSRLGRWKVPGKHQPPILSLYTCNPNQRWPKERFYKPYLNGTLRPKHYYLPAKITDNPHVSEEYLEQLRALPEKHRSVFFDGNWEYADSPDQLIKGEWIEATFARTPTLVGRHNGLGVDVARYGDDESVQARTIAWHLAELLAFQGIDTVESARLAHSTAVTHQIPPHGIIVDTVGVGAGVADSLFRTYKMKPTEFIAGAKPKDTHKFLKFKNLRSEAWWNLREVLQNGPASFDPSLPLEYRNKLVSDLVAQRYTVDTDKVIEVVSKDVIKSELGRSPDYGDAVMQVYAEMNSAAGFFGKINNR